MRASMIIRICERLTAGDIDKMKRLYFEISDIFNKGEDIDIEKVDEWVSENFGLHWEDWNDIWPDEFAEIVAMRKLDAIFDEYEKDDMNEDYIYDLQKAIRSARKLTHSVIAEKVLKRIEQWASKFEVDGHPMTLDDILDFGSLN